MPRAKLIACYDDLAGTLAAAWDFLEAGVRERDSAFHAPVIGSLGEDGRPRQRVMVLRQVDPLSRELRFHTDLRSEKRREIERDPRLSALAYDPAHKVQIRLEGHGRLHHGDGFAEAAWAGARRMSRVCYATTPAPGDTIASGGGFALADPTDEAALAAGYAHFAVLIFRVERLEWLYLAVEGHRRAHFAWDEAGGVSADWRVP